MPLLAHSYATKNTYSVKLKSSECAGTPNIETATNNLHCCN